MIGYGNTVNSKFMEAYLGAGVAANANAEVSADAALTTSTLVPTPNNWLSWGKMMPIDYTGGLNST